MPLEAGRVIGDKYVLRREIGRGGVCVVTDAVHRFTGRAVAVKRLLPEMHARMDLRARLLREAEALGAIRHPSVVEIYDAGEEEDGAPYLVLEQLQGRTLAGLLAARTRLELREAMNVAWQTCGALVAAHAVAVVHRDVKPENLIVAGDALETARVKLIDFGLATAPRGSSSPKLTRHGAFLGTPEYMPPEALGRVNVPSPASDVYAVGVTLYECLAGRVPVPGTADEILARLATSPAPPIEAFCKDVPRALSALLAHALAKDPERRFPTARAFAEGLEQVAAELGAPASRATQQLPRVSQPEIRASQPDLDRAPPSAPRVSQPSMPRVSQPSMPRVSQPSMPRSSRPEIELDPNANLGPQRRETRRAPYRTPVRIEFDVGAFDARSEDLSRGGMLAVVVPSGRPPGVGARARVRFALPSTGEMATLQAVVRWVKPRESGATAIGLEFSAVDPRVRESLDQFVEILGQDVTV